MKEITQSKFHRGFYKLNKEGEEVKVCTKDGEEFGVWLSMDCYTALVNEKHPLMAVESKIDCSSASTSLYPGIVVEDGEMKVLSLEELKAKFPQADALQQPIDIPDNIEVEEKCVKCENKSDGVFSEITDSDGWQEFNICKSCAKKFRVRINKKL